MPTETVAARVAVLGGGIFGASTAVHLARAGAQVSLVMGAGRADGASGRSLAWLNSFGRHPPEYHALRLHCLRRLRHVAESDRAAGRFLRFDGALHWVTEAETSNLADHVEQLSSSGYPVEWVSAKDVARMVPGVDPSVIPESGAVLARQEGWADLPAMIDHLTQKLIDLGGSVLDRSGRAEVVVKADRVVGVRLEDGERRAVDGAVLTVGAEVPAALARLGVTIPERTTTGLLVRTRPVNLGLRAVVQAPRVAIRPGPRGTLAMDAGWSEREVVHADDGSYRVPAETVEGLLREASAVLEGQPQLRVADVGVGPKPIPGDGAPVFGALAAVAGCYVAFSHSGATLGYGVGELLAEEVLTGDLHPLARPFRPDRFARTQELDSGSATAPGPG